MKVGLIITLHNRANLTSITFDCLAASEKLPDLIVLIDDGSTEEAAIRLFNNFYIQAIPIIKIRSLKPIGIKRSLLQGIEFCQSHGCDVITNIDNDVALKPNWLNVLLSLFNKFPSTIITGFHSTTKNRDGSERHRIIASYDGYCLKESVGGINMMFSYPTYEKYIKPTLLPESGNWDHMSCINLKNDGKRVVCSVPSVIQHTGIVSSLGHNELPDTADDFYDLHLPDVTLIGVDCFRFDLLKRAAHISSLGIKFGATKLITYHHGDGDNPFIKTISYPISNKEQYSEFVIKHIAEYVNTSHMLIIQSDGFVLNPNAWDDSWLQYDYIGATWLYKDGMNVGNGGFSLRSKKLMSIMSTFDIRNFHPEDSVICRLYRSKLEDMGIKFAPEEVANKFSIEAYGSSLIEGANKYSGQFGFHGYNVDFSTANNIIIKPTKKW